MSDSESESNNPRFVFEDGVPIVRRLSDVERKQAEAESRDQKYKQDQVDLNKKLVCATVGLVVATFILGGIQLWYMHRQWKLTSDSLSKMGDQVWAAKDAASAAKNAADTAQKEMRLEQRAWVGMTFPNLDEGKELSKKSPNVVFQCPFEISNWGRTPARMIEINANCSILPNGSEQLDLGENGPKHHTRIRFESIQPNETVKDWGIAAIMVENGKPRPLFTTPELWQRVKTSDLEVIAHGKLTYIDSFGKEHWVRFCHAYSGTVGGPENCYRYNDSDHDSR